MDATKKCAEKPGAKGKQIGFKEPLRMDSDYRATDIRQTESSHWKRPTPLALLKSVSTWQNRFVASSV